MSNLKKLIEMGLNINWILKVIKLVTFTNKEQKIINNYEYKSKVAFQTGSSVPSISSVDFSCIFFDPSQMDTIADNFPKCFNSLAL
jgi:hypothetical protein